MSGSHKRIHSYDIEGNDKSLCSLGERISEESADRAVKKVFAILGVDINKPESVEEFREDLRFGKKLRKLADHGVFVLTALLFTGLAWASFEGIITRIKK